MNGNKRVVFFYPSKIVGGAEYLFLRLARILLHKKWHVYYVDYKNGFARQELAQDGIEFLNYQDGEQTAIDFPCQIIFPISNFYNLTNFLDIHVPDVKLLFWSLQPYNIVYAFPESKTAEKLNIRYIPSFFKYCCRHSYTIFRTILLKLDILNSLYFMDNLSFDMNRKIFNHPFSKELPILCNEKEIPAKDTLCEESHINVAVLGRLSSEKIYPLINVLEQLNGSDFSKPIHVYIIGEGNCKSQIVASKYNNLQLHFLGTLSIDKVDQFLREKIDILFAMGTSSLEGCALKLPVILLTPSLFPLTNSMFYFIYDYSNFTLNPDARAYSMKQILQMFCQEHLKGALGRKCYEYFKHFHSPSAVTEKLEKAMKDNELTFEKYSYIKNNAGKLTKNRNILYLLVKLYTKMEKLYDSYLRTVSKQTK